MAICHNKKYEREFVKLMIAQGLTCFRIAGSGIGDEAVCDCVLYLPESCLVEVKATKEDVMYMRSGVKEQLQKMMDVCEKDSLIPLLAVKFKHRGWNIIKLESLENVRFDKGWKIENLRTHLGFT